MPKVSVIVPVFQVEKFLKNCLQSILTQTLTDIEIILLNDGSTDASLKICEEYAAKDKRISVYSHENRGLGSTRNRGITLAKGDYLAFVDSDDHISPDGLERLLQKAEVSGADIIQGETLIYEDGSDCSEVRASLGETKDIILTEDNLESFFVDYYFARVYSHNAWDKLYRRDFVLKNNLVFGDNRKIFAEDNWFQLQALHYLPSVAFVPTAYYWYRQQSDSIMHKPKKDLIARHSRMIDDYRNFIKDGNRLTERKVCAVVASEIFTMEALNSKFSDNPGKVFMKVIDGVRQYQFMIDAVIDLYAIHAADLYRCNRFRRLYLLTVGWLYQRKMYKTAHRFVWFLYKKR
jgi:Glycosyltransferases involved in cell wall biogenesis